MVTKTRKTPVRKADIARARERLLAKPVPVRQITEKPDTQSEKGKAKWVGVVYCDAYGWAWLADLKAKNSTLCLGKTQDVLEAIKDIDPDEPTQIKNAVLDFRAGKQRRNITQDAPETHQNWAERWGRDDRGKPCTGVKNT